MPLNPVHDSTTDGSPPADVPRRVGRAADTLVAAIDEASQASGGWSDLPLAYALIEAALGECLMRLSATRLWGRDNQLPSVDFWKIAGPVLRPGWLQTRAREKPLGYAGDYEMLARIIENRCCDGQPGAMFDQYFLSRSAPQAVHGRTQLVAASLVQHRLSRTPPYSVCSVGCGPGIDLQRGLARLPAEAVAQVQVRLVDLDDAGLAFARDRLTSILAPAALETYRENLFRLGRRPESAACIGQPDFLVCSGLFDYLEDDAAVELLRSFWQRLAPGGRLLVGNFVPYHPTRAYMEWIGNWYLHYRTSAALTVLGDAAGIPAACRQVGAERTGTDLFLQANKE